MSTLRELIEARKDSTPSVVRCVEEDIRPVAMVTFHPWQGKVWTLPWSRLEAWGFCNEAEQEQIEFLFPHHYIVLAGENLRRTSDPLKTFLVSGLRALPPSHRVKLRPGEPFIEHMEVRLLGGLKSLSAAADPLRPF
jgi:hypothetical protein